MSSSQFQANRQNMFGNSPTDWQKFFNDEMNEHLDVVHKTTRDLYEPFYQLCQVCLRSLQQGGKILFFGNGGSAADAQHLATELTVRYKDNRPPIAALALTTDTSALTAIGNDYSFEDLFARQIEALGRAGDVAIGITTSGQSPNVLKALQKAKSLGITAAALSGKDGGKLKGLADPLLIVPSNTTSRIQEMHITLGQMLCGALEKALGLVA
jgi:D-sedoheptulose 7-phosphate isomerase